MVLPDSIPLLGIVTRWKLRVIEKIIPPIINTVASPIRIYADSNTTGDFSAIALSIRIIRATAAPRILSTLSLSLHSELVSAPRVMLTCACIDVVVKIN